MPEIKQHALESSNGLAVPFVEQHPELFPDLKTKRLAGKVLPKLSAHLSSEIRARFESDYALRVQRHIEDLNEQNRKLIETEIKKIREAAKPPEPADIQKLLDQEYLEFQVHVREVTQEGGVRTRQFLIRELPLEIEMQLLKAIERRVIPMLKEIGRLDFSGSLEEKMGKLMNALPDGLHTFAELASLCLDPWKRADPPLTTEWVLTNLSANRILHILEAQLEAGRLRDFFLGVSRLIPAGTTA